jgi:ABC-type Co2+ transport system permease subunit
MGWAQHAPLFSSADWLGAQQAELSIFGVQHAVAAWVVFTLQTPVSGKSSSTFCAAFISPSIAAAMDRTCS